MSSLLLSDVHDAPVGAFCMPERVRHVFPRHLLQGWLRRLCRELDLRLHAPVSVVKRGEKRIVTVFRVIEYTVDGKRRVVSCRVRCHENRLAPKEINVDLWRPVRASYWMPWFMADMGLWDHRPEQRDLFEAERSACRDWLAGTAFRLLQRDPRFRLLREKWLPEALNLDGDLVAIALRARIFARACPLESNVYSRVWRNEPAFRQVAAENPQLLPLLHAYAIRGGLRSAGDPVSLLKACLRKEGVPEAAWRYVSRHGARIFRTLWELTPHNSPLTVASLYLQRLYQVGLPPPPPAALLRAWAAQIDLYDLLFLNEYWDPGLCAIYRIAFNEADRIKATNRFAPFLDEFLGVVAWAEATGLRLDRNQRRAGWALLERRWREAQHQLPAPARAQSWTSLVPEFELGDYRIVPLTSRADLLAEGRAMRNCIADYAGRARGNQVRLFSIRLRQSGRRRADLLLRYLPEESQWLMGQLAGPANRSAAEEVHGVATEIARRYNDAQAHSPLPATAGFQEFAEEDRQVQRELDDALAALRVWYDGLRQPEREAAR